MKKTIISAGFLICFLLNACSHQKVLDEGKIYDHIALESDSSLSYAIYLPHKKIADAKLAFIFFDPHGSGELPVKMYKKLADEFGIILVGNNNSSNTMDFNLISSDFGSLLVELKKNYQLEDRNIALWGFSGGAKAALSNAGNNNAISSCIYGGSVIDVQNKLHLLGFNGKQDMNFTDLLSFAAQHDKDPDHFQILFNGKHAWPDSLTATDAFRWFLFNKMQRKEIEQDARAISTAYEKYKKELDKNIGDNHLPDALLTCNKALHFLTGLTDVSYFTDKKSFIKTQDAFKVEMQELQSTFTKEMQIKERYQQEIFTKDTIYWKKEIDGLWKNSKTDVSGMYDRLLGFLSLAGYSYANRAFQGNDINAIRQVLFIYRHSDPTNPEQAFMRAKLYVLENDRAKARAALQEAILLGLDKSRISNDVLLKNL